MTTAPETRPAATGDRPADDERAHPRRDRAAVLPEHRAATAYATAAAFARGAHRRPDDAPHHHGRVVVGRPLPGALALLRGLCERPTAPVVTGPLSRTSTTQSGSASRCGAGRRPDRPAQPSRRRGPPRAGPSPPGAGAADDGWPGAGEVRQPVRAPPASGQRRRSAARNRRIHGRVGSTGLPSPAPPHESRPVRKAGTPCRTPGP